MNFRSLLFRAVIVVVLLGGAYGVSVATRRSDAALSGPVASTPASVLLPLVGLPLVYLLSLP